MNPLPFSKKDIALGLAVGILIPILLFFISLYDQRTKIVFCDVGQGDAIYIRIKNRVDVLIDAGPDNKITGCLGKYMPFYDKKIELAILSHPQKDHFYGFIPVLQRYKIDSIVMFVPETSVGTNFNQLLKLLQDKKVKIISLFNVNSISLLNDQLTFLYPDKNRSYNNINDVSLVFLFQENDFKALFTGDTEGYILDRLSEKSKDLLTNIDIIKIPHHGSKTGLSKKILMLANPKVAVITVGKNNSYGHPTKEVLDLLKALKIKIKRTDINGDIIFKIALLNFNF